jgi:tetraacyldisaccharide 4'-kinase
MPSQTRPDSALVAALGDWWAGRMTGERVPGALQQRAVIAAAGIGHPERFFGMLEAAGLRIERLPLPDHATLHPRPWSPGATPVVVTEKDAVKLPPQDPEAPRLYVAALDLSLPDSVVQTLLGWLPPPRPAPEPHGPPTDRPARLPDLQGAADAGPRRIEPSQ